MAAALRAWASGWRQTTLPRYLQMEPPSRPLGTPILIAIGKVQGRSLSHQARRVLEGVIELLPAALRWCGVTK